MPNFCPRCFEERGLQRRIEEIRPNYPNTNKCTFHPKYKGVPATAVAAIVDGVFRSNYGIGDFYSVPMMDSERVEHRQEGGLLLDALCELVEPETDEVANALQDQLCDDELCWPPDGDEPFYEQDQSYIHLQPDTYYHSNIWNRFCTSIVHDRRFFNVEAKELIAEIFDGIHFQRDHQKHSPVHLINPGEDEATFFRAREANDAEKRWKLLANPEEELGPPPERLRRAGRTNPAGVCACYCAYDIATCVAELRPVVGSVVVAAKFELVRSIYVLDTTLFEAPIQTISPFHKNHITRMAQWAFMQGFMHEIAKPVAPDDEHIDYIPTQAVAEYLNCEYGFKRSGKEVKIEAIIYHSAQSPIGKNVVLLGDAALVRRSDKVDQEEAQVSSFTDLLPQSFASILAETSKPKNPALKYSADTARSLKVSGAQYKTDRPWEYDLGDFDF